MVLGVAVLPMAGGVAVVRVDVVVGVVEEGPRG